MLRIEQLYNQAAILLLYVKGEHFVECVLVFIIALSSLNDLRHKNLIQAASESFHVLSVL